MRCIGTFANLLRWHFGFDSADSILFASFLFNSLPLNPFHFIFLHTICLALISLMSPMPQIPGIITATAAIARDRAGRRGSAPAPRHERSQLPDNVPNVSVGLNGYLFHDVAFASSSMLTPYSDYDSIPSEADQHTPNSYEAILLGPDENKIDVEVDTRKCPGLHIMM